MHADQGRFRSRIVWIVTGLGLVLLVAVAFGHALRVPFSHDEHQFVAGGALLAQGLIPYRDFPLHHVPYQLALYAVPPFLTDRLLLAARLLSGFFAAGALLLLFFVARKAWKAKVGGWAPLAGLATATMVVASPLFGYTSGRAWNHDLSVFLVLASLALLLQGDRGPKGLVLGSGLALGFATGTRLTAGLAAAPMIIFLLLKRRSDLRSLGSAVWKFVSGLVLALIPAGVLILLAPSRFYYGNWLYHQLNTEYRQLLSHDEAMSLLGKGRYFFERVVIEPAHLILLGALIVVIGFAIFRSNMLTPFSGATLLTFSISIFLFLGSLLPTPSWPQYFYAPLPFIVLALSLGIADLAPPEPRSVWVPVGMLMAALAMVVLGAGFIEDWYALIRPSETTVARAHRITGAMEQELGQGKAITLAPIFPLEAGASIEPALASGPFTYRVAPLLDREARERYGLLTPAELVERMKNDPPAALLTGVESGNIGLASDPEGNVEDPLIAFAESEGYRPVMISNDLFDGPLKLWLKPE